MKCFILLCCLPQIIVAVENITTITSLSTLSEPEAVLLEEKIMKTPPKDLHVNDVRRIVQYLIETKRETYESLMDKLEYGKHQGYTAKMLSKFAQGQSYIEVVDYLTIYYSKTHNQSLVCPPPPAPESHWYDIFWSNRPSSGSSDSSEKNDRPAAYRVLADQKGDPAYDHDQTANNNSDKTQLLQENECFTLRKRHNTGKIK